MFKYMGRKEITHKIVTGKLPQVTNFKKTFGLTQTDTKFYVIIFILFHQYPSILKLLNIQHDRIYPFL